MLRKEREGEMVGCRGEDWLFLTSKTVCATRKGKKRIRSARNGGRREGKGREGEEDTSSPPKMPAKRAPFDRKYFVLSLNPALA